MTKITLDLDDELYNSLREEHEFNNEGYNTYGNKNPDKRLEDFIIRILKAWDKYEGVLDDTKERLMEIRSHVDAAIKVME
jgi:hypothetical protein